MKKAPESKRQRLLLVALAVLVSAVLTAPAALACPDCTGFNSRLLTTCTEWEMTPWPCQVRYMVLIDCQTGEVIFEDEISRQCVIPF